MFGFQTCFYDNDNRTSQAKKLIKTIVLGKGKSDFLQKKKK